MLDPDLLLLMIISSISFLGLEGVKEQINEGNKFLNFTVGYIEVITIAILGIVWNRNPCK